MHECRGSDGVKRGMACLKVVADLAMNVQGFAIVEGESNLASYEDKMTDSGKPLTRTFCSNCGSNLFNFTPLRKDIVSISAGAFDDFEDWKPSLEQYCIHRADFLEKAKNVDKRYVESISGEMETEGVVETEQPS